MGHELKLKESKEDETGNDMDLDVDHSAISILKKLKAKIIQ